MHKKIVIFSLFALFVFAGCNTTYYYSEFIKPSQTYIPAKIYVVGVLNRGATAQMTTPIYVNGVAFDHIKEIPKRAGDKTIDALKKELAGLGRFQLVDIPWEGEMRNARKFMEDGLTKEEVDSLCNVYEVAGIIALEGVEMTIRTQGDVSVITVNDEMGMPVRIPEFSNRQEVSYTAAWRFYDGYSLTGIDTYQETYQRIFNTVAYTEAEASQINPQNMPIMDVVKEAAYDYSKRISPYWEPGYRLYYGAGSPEMYYISQNLQYDGDWTKAAEEWKKLTLSSDDKIRRMAMFNMAVASEMLGSPRVAKDWLTKSIEFKSTKHSKKYLETLERQIVVYEVVDKQLGI